MKTILFPGQGAQTKGMGRELFAAYPELEQKASNLLGYSLKELCLEDPENQLNLTQYTQPALYVVNALGYRHKQEQGEITVVDFLAGHSLGEYNALLAAEVFDFETGLKLVQKRGELMGQASGGGMLAVVGTEVDRIKEVLAESDLSEIDLANYNTPLQTVVSGLAAAIERTQNVFDEQGIRYVPLKVSAAFHSRYMKGAQEEFAQFLQRFNFTAPKIPVIANATARPYEPDQIATTLSAQIASSVLWSKSIQYLLSQGEMEFVEIGSMILSNMVKQIQLVARS